jgi:hypothetical protein
MSTALTERSNGNGLSEIVQPRTIGQTSEQSRAIAEIQSALTIAANRPRDEQSSIDRILIACQRQGLAEVSEYTFARGGSNINGATIDLMTAIANYWGNINYGFRELSQQNGESTVEAFAWDLESNAKTNRIFQVPHKIKSGGGLKVLTDPTDIYYLIANQAQRRVRACLEAVIPADVVDLARAECAKTLREKVKVTPETIKALLFGFLEFDVTQPEIEERLQRRIDTMTPSQYIDLRKVWKSMKDGMSNKASWFKAKEESPESGTGLKERMKAKAAAKKPAPPIDPEIDDDEALRAEAARREAMEAGELFEKGPSTYE